MPAQEETLIAALSRDEETQQDLLLYLGHPQEDASPTVDLTSPLWAYWNADDEDLYLGGETRSEIKLLLSGLHEQAMTEVDHFIQQQQEQLKQHKLSMDMSLEYYRLQLKEKLEVSSPVWSTEVSSAPVDGALSPRSVPLTEEKRRTIPSVNFSNFADRYSRLSEASSAWQSVDMSQTPQAQMQQSTTVRSVRDRCSPSKVSMWQRGPRRNVQGSTLMRKSATSKRLLNAYENLVDAHRTPAGSRIVMTTLAVTETLGDWRFCKNSVFCEQLESIILGRAFNLLVAVVIVSNALFIGVTSNVIMEKAIEHHMEQEENTGLFVSGAWVAMEYAFNAFFLIELLLRLITLQGKFCCGEDKKWNLFDFVIVLNSFGELWLSSQGLTNYIPVLRVARVIRSMRLLRLIRFTSFFRKLRTILLAMLNFNAMLFWAFVVLLMTVYLFSVTFLNIAALRIYEASDGDPLVEELMTYFPSLPMTMLTLFMSVSGGIDWWVAVKPLLEIGVSYAVIFVVFVVISQLAILNVISAIFVNDAMETTRMDPDMRMQMEVEETRFAIERLTEIFAELASGSLLIPKGEFVKRVESMENKLKFAMLGLHFVDPVNFFKSLDVDQNGEVGIDEFVMGCLRLKSGAILMDIDVAVQNLAVWTKTTLKEQQQVIKNLETSVNLTNTRLSE